MNIGTNDWIRNLDHVAHQMEEVLSLEGTVVVQRATELQVEARKLARQRAFLREERRRARMEEELLRLNIADFSMMKNDDWIPAECASHPYGERVRLNVGGQLFEASKAVFRRDPACLLAALCHDGGPPKVDLDGTVSVDRDWWMFRYVIKFLREGILPIDSSLLTQLYREAGYWRCESLKRAIEEQMHLYRSTFEGCTSGGTQRERIVAEAWWRTPLNTWEAKEASQPATPTKAVENPEEAAVKDDWWTGSDIGRSRPDLKINVSPKDENIQLATSTTWTTQNECRPCLW
ncbi:unnamed protein product [Pylaiella littoralis]